MILIVCYDWLQFITGKVFIPLAWIMGVKWEECDEVARLVGIKTIINEFVAYQQMGESKRAGLLSVSIVIFEIFRENNVDKILKVSCIRQALLR